MTNEILRQREVDAAIKALYREGNITHNFGDHVVQNIRRNVRFLVINSPETLNEIIASSRSNSLEEFLWGEIMQDPKMSPKRRIRGDRRWSYMNKYRIALVAFQFIRRVAEFDERITAGHVDHYAMDQLRHLMEDVIERRSLRKTTSDDRLEALAIFIWVHAPHVRPTNMFFSVYDFRYEDHLRELHYLAKRIDEVRDIIPQLTERKSCERAVVDMLLDAPAPSLAVGML
jgi:hypothetical protein